MRRHLFHLALAGATWLACGGGSPTADSAQDLIPSGNPNGKDDGGACGQGQDCKSGVCTGGKCAAPTSNDGVRNGSETGLDCGGAKAPTCAGGQPCLANTDCSSGQCGDDKHCAGAADAKPATSTDGIKNGDESDVDCGGSNTNAPRCVPGKTCNAGPDCDSKVCGQDGKCAVPSGTDGQQNGDETDVDCGGKTTNAPRCDAGKTCAIHDDCASNGCDDQKKCGVGRSCTQADGGRTCGQGEVGDADAKHESCCGALPIPGMNTKLDKYKVTAGRMRAFIERVNGDVAGWYAANHDSVSQEAQDQLDGVTDNLPHSVDEANQHLGGFIFLTDRPSTLQGCFTGNANNQANGSHTYWTPNDGLAAQDVEDRGFDQAFLDRLPLNCVPYPLMAAFCAWDGGRLQTYEENSAAYGDGFYPWGNAPEAGGFADLGGGNWGPYGPAATRPGAAAPGPCPGCNTTLMNWTNSYQNPEGGNPNKPWDYAYFMSPPGRFPADVGAGGHMDLGGILMELTASPGVSGPGLQPNDPEYGPTVRWSRAGSWEGHSANNTQWQFALMTKYGKVGGRCARD
jgi:hypothetical protein